MEQSEESPREKVGEDFLWFVEVLAIRYPFCPRKAVRGDRDTYIISEKRL